VRLTPDAAGGTRVELGGLARTDRAGYGEEFDRLTAQVLGTDMQESRETEDRR
jgi:cytochrome c biogenesis protein